MERLQNGHGGWNDNLKPLVGKPVVIQFFDSDGDIVAMLGKAGKLACFNPKATKKAEKVRCRENTEAIVGSTVRVSASAAEFQRLQTEQFGGWSSTLEQLIGRTLRVLAISCKYQVETTSPECTIKVQYDDRNFWLNPMAVTVQKDGTGGAAPEVVHQSTQSIDGNVVKTQML